jgi:uncharacterized protein DUF222
MEASSLSPRSGSSHPHPVLACADRLGAALDEVADVEPMYMPIPAKAEALRRLSALEARVHELKLRVLDTADDVATDAGARSAGAWLAHETRCGRAEAKTDEHLAHALTRRWTQVREALAAGMVTRRQATVIVTALDELPRDLGHELKQKAEAHLLAEAGHFDPVRLRTLGHHLLEVLAPDLAEAEERKRLENAEAAARRTTRLGLRSRGDGSTDLHARIPDHVAARLRTYLESMTGPRRPEMALDDDVARLPYPRRLGQALCALLERLPGHLLPQHGGTATTVMVTLTLEHLLTGLGTAELLTGERITAGQARRLACTAGLVPVVLGADSEILDLGRERRLFSPAQRKAMALRDRECRAHGCTVPAAWCEAHHPHPWSHGGHTNLAEGTLLCPWHHHRAHDPDFEVTRPPDGDIRFHRRR